ncbi:hypothetical protein QFZ23_002093 [Arthrobacter globiformis]|uniref:hypothetical protein n=1 Tax=Arthrobacter globiformis TaxID=1665 RepID=UPI002788750D|nr:hypothetical protein [Arthrobacter globiformis]MDQ1058192.1 hypothetical protein [Arthrobacter globiformis]
MKADDAPDPLLMPYSVFRTGLRVGFAPGVLLVLFKLHFGVPVPPATVHCFWAGTG